MADVNGGLAAGNAAAASSGTPSASGRQELVSGTQGPPASGGKKDKSGEGSGAQKHTRDEAAKGMRVRGVQSQSQVYAIMSVVVDTGGDTAGKELMWTDKFLLTGATQQQAERYQILESFMKSLIYFMDKAPEIYSYSGVLYNCTFEGGEENWRNAFLRAYDDLLRGTKCVENRARVYLDYDGLLVAGYILNNQVSQSADAPGAVNFSFNLFVTSRKVLG